MRNISGIHEAYIERCLQLALNGEGFTAPNPMVGAVLVHNDRIIGEGWHHFVGGVHAEVNALAAVLPEDKHLIPDATLYVNLEPCNHQGKTPPCTDLILREKISRVVIGSVDDNPMVGGKGIARLKANGVEVISGVLEKECRKLNRHFFIAHQLQRPYITLKWAESREGNIALADGQPVAISSPLTKRFSHRLRSQHMGIVVGSNTVIHDRPELTNRLWYGKSPQVIVLDLSGRLNHDPYFLQQTSWWRWISPGNILRESDFSTPDLTSFLDHLYQQGIQSILVEGGAKTHQAFLNAGIWDELIIYQGNVSISQGLAAAKFKGVLKDSFQLDTDIIKIFHPQ